MSRRTYDPDSGEDLGKALDIADAVSGITIVSERPLVISGSDLNIAVFEGQLKSKGVRYRVKNAAHVQNGTKRFTFKGMSGTVDDHGFISLGGKGFQWEAADAELKKAIESQTGMAWMNSKHFQNGVARAQAFLNERMVNIRPMTVEEIIKGAREGRWDPQQDVKGKRPGQHVWVKINGKDVHIEVKG